MSFAKRQLELMWPFEDQDEYDDFQWQMESDRSMQEAMRDYQAYKERQYQNQCPHYEHDHFICLDCGKDIMHDMIRRAELLEDR